MKGKLEKSTACPDRSVVEPPPSSLTYYQNNKRSFDNIPPAIKWISLLRFINKCTGYLAALLGSKSLSLSFCKEIHQAKTCLTILHFQFLRPKWLCWGVGEGNFSPKILRSIQIVTLFSVPLRSVVYLGRRFSFPISWTWTCADLPRVDIVNGMMSLPN